jgi:hypothetical protein
MSYQIVRELRIKGDRENALKTGYETLLKEPANQKIKYLLAWVLYDDLKEKCYAEKADEFIQTIKQLIDLKLPENDPLLNEKITWQIIKYLSFHIKEENLNNKQLDLIAPLFNVFPPLKNSTVSSALLSTFLRYKTLWFGFLPWMNLLTWEGFHEEDYEEPDMGLGKKLMSRTEQAYIRAGKILEERASHQVNDHLKNEILIFISALEKIIREKPHFLYPPYYLAKLWLILKEKEKALYALLPFARIRRKEFWVWDLLARVFPTGDERAFWCYCKALSCQTRDEFLYKVRLHFLPLLIEKELFQEARNEIKSIQFVSKIKDWPYPSYCKQLENEAWYQSTVHGRTNNDLYGRYILKASEILSTFLPISEGIVISIDAKKVELTYMPNKEERVSLISDFPLENINIGNIIAVSAEKQRTGRPYRIFSIKRLEEKEINHPMRRVFSGKLRLSQFISLGFVDDVMVEYFTHKHLYEGALVEGIAIPSFDNKKNKWGWKALNLIKISK